jgi:uncharacterized protein YndB with AHSA1/START domain
VARDIVTSGGFEVSSSNPISEAGLLRYIGAVTREVLNRDHDGKPARVVVATCAYDSGIADVWDAVTSPERVERWFLPLTGDLRVGGRYQLQGNAGGEITACEPPHAFDITWEFGGQISWVNVRLSELSDGGTRLRLEHTAHVPDEMWTQFGPGAVGVGWDLTLLGLGRHVETGFSVDPKEAMAWLMSEEGKAVVTRSSEDWCQASIASGTPEAAAREAGARTTAFYTGQA